MLIRPATPADVTSLLVLEQQSVTAAHWSAAQYQTAITGSSPRCVALVAEAESAIHGFLVARAADREWEIENIVIATVAQHRGLGTRLLREFLELARRQHAESVFLEVRSSNHAARALYQKCAFVEIGRRPRYYHEPVEDAVLYRFPSL